MPNKDRWYTVKITLSLQNNLKEFLLNPKQKRALGKSSTKGFSLFIYLNGNATGFQKQIQNLENHGISSTESNVRTRY